MILVLYLGHGDFFPSAIKLVYFFLQKSFFGLYEGHVSRLLKRRTNLRKKCGARLYRGTRLPNEGGADSTVPPPKKKTAIFL